METFVLTFTTLSAIIVLISAEAGEYVPFNLFSEVMTLSTFTAFPSLSSILG